MKFVNTWDYQISWLRQSEHQLSLNRHKTLKKGWISIVRLKEIWFYDTLAFSLCVLPHSYYVVSHWIMAVSSHAYYLQNKVFLTCVSLSQGKDPSGCIMSVSFMYQLLLPNSSFLRILWCLVPNELLKKNVALGELSRFFGAANIIREPIIISQYLYKY